MARQAPDLEDLDWAVEQNFARHDGEDFDPGFFLQGESWRTARTVSKTTLFLDRIVGAAPDAVVFRWRGREVSHQRSTAPGIPDGGGRGGASSG